MSKFMTFAKKSARESAALLGLHLVKSRYSRWQYELYAVNERPDRPRYVNLGAGSFYHPFWHNVDMPNEYYSVQQNHLHISHDFTKALPLPFHDHSVEVFYSSHVIEHLSDAHVQSLFNEIYRCLAPGGIVRITCPDMELQYQAYKQGDYGFWAQPSPWRTRAVDVEQRFLEHFATALAENHSWPGVKALTTEEFVRLFEEHSMHDFFDSISTMIPQNANELLPEGHCNWFSFEKLKNMLTAAGFGIVNNSRYLQSSDPRLRDPRLFDGTCPELSLYVECRK